MGKKEPTTLSVSKDVYKRQALGVAKSPFGRNITAPHQLAELVHNIGQALALNDVEIVIFLGHRDA